MKKLVTTTHRQALNQAPTRRTPTRKSPPAKAPPPSKAEQAFMRETEFKRKFPIFASTPTGKARLLKAAQAFAAELTRKG